MPGILLEEIGKYLESTDSSEIIKGLSMLKENAWEIREETAGHILERLMSFFYIDPLDRPDLLPVLNETISAISTMGEWVIPFLLNKLDAGDLKAQMAISHALGRIGVKAITPLIAEFSLSADSGRRAFILYALSKIKAPEIIAAIDAALECASSHDLELRDTATRVLGKFAEVIPPCQIQNDKKHKIIICLQTNMSDNNPGIRAKAVRSFGKFARYQHLNSKETQLLITACRQILGEDSNFDWDRAYIVRKEAKEAISYVEEYI